MIVKFYKFSKRENSTKLPSTPHLAAPDCMLKSTSSIVDPVIDIQIGGMTAWPDWNYAYIPIFDRYYYISDITSIGSVFRLQLTCDILATYKTDIANADLYCLRASAESDGSIPDDYYPMPATLTQHIESVQSPWLHVGSAETINITDGGCFIIGVVSSDNIQARYGSLMHYALPRSSLQLLCNKLLSALDDPLNGFDSNDASLALQKTLVDPISFIKSCYWVPVLYADVSPAVETSTLNIWSWTLEGIPHKFISNNPPYVQYAFAVPITKHPDAATRGKWLNLEPYTRMSLLVPPFGLIDLDTSLYVDQTEVRGTVMLDLITGICTLLIQAGSTRTHCLKSQVSVPIPLSQISNDIIGGGGGLIGGLVAAAVGAFTMNPMALLGGIAAGVGSAVGAMKPHESSIGSMGSFSELHGKIYLYEDFYTTVAEDNDHVGRPLCKIRKPSAIPGFIKVMDGDIPIAGTAGEQSALKAQLERGFYYE
jgi:hypothetical protein